MTDKTGGANQPAAAAPKPDAEEEVTQRPVDDNPASENPPTEEAARSEQQEDQPPRPQPVNMSPLDEKRQRMVARFEKRREQEETGETEEPPKATEEQQESLPAAKLKLKVDGDETEHSIDEVARRADLTPDEVRADPARAQRYAQRELATTRRLEIARRIREAAKPAPSHMENEDIRPRAPAPDQERTEPEQDEAGRQDGDRNTSGVDFKKLAEAIQIEDPEKAGDMLKEAIEEAGKRAAAAVVNEEQVNDRIRRDVETIASAMKAFEADHKDVAGNKFVINAMRPALVDEYRVDLRKALEAEGDIETADAVAEASDNDVMKAHQRRRLRGDPHVRQIDKSFLESAYSRVTAGLGQVTPKTEEDFTASREARKANLSPQPRRASVPPARPPARPPSQEQDRREGLAMLRQGRGKTNPSR